MRTAEIVPRGAVSDQSIRSLIPRAFAASRGRRASAVDATAGAEPGAVVRSVATVHPLVAATGIHAGELDADGLDSLAVEEAKAASAGGGSDLQPAA
jgi:hypothetical protein